jgi:hypothetical protein
MLISERIRKGRRNMAGIFHFKILGALGFFFLIIILWVIAGAIADGYR